MKSKAGVLLCVQADHLNGETLGAAIEILYKAGASNVNIVSSITKKNRPGYLLFIDCPLNILEKIETIIAAELRVSGWHRIDTQHCYHNVRQEKKQVEIICPGDSFPFLAEGKVMDDDLVNLRPESGCCVSLKAELERRDCRVPLLELEKKIYQVLTDCNAKAIRIRKEA